MSNSPIRIGIVGATGLIGQEVLRLAVGREDLRMVGIARREVPLPPGSRIEVFVAEPGQWGDAFAAARPTALICAIGTTLAKSGGDRRAFYAVDHDLVVETAKAAKEAGIERFVAISAAGAERHSKNFYLSVKGEAEDSLAKVGFHRLDILRPGLLRGKRESDRRIGERLAILASPLIDPLLHGKMRPYRSIAGTTVAAAAMALAMRHTQGRYVHDNDGIRRAAATLPMPTSDEPAPLRQPA